MARDRIQRRTTALTVEAAEAIARAEGLTLHRDPSSTGGTGFKAVHYQPRMTNLHYFVKALGKGYPTAGAAALAYARYRKSRPDKRLTAGGKWQYRSGGVGRNIAVLPA